MKLFFFCLLLFLNISQSSLTAQSLKIRTSIGYNTLLIDQETKNENSPFEYTVTNQSFEQFFDPSASYAIELNYEFFVNEITYLKMMFGFNYEKNSLALKNNRNMEVLGETVYQSKYSPFIGIGKVFGTSDANIFIYGMASIVVVEMEGEGRIPLTNNLGDILYVNGITEYKQGTNIKLSAGIDFERLFKSNFFIGIRASYEVGSSDVNKVKLYYEQQTLPDVHFTGEKTFKNNSISLDFSVGYQIGLFN